MDVGSEVRCGPVTEPERVAALDVLRGVAVLGIFVMNSRNFALPLREFDNPAFPEGPVRARDVWVWAVENAVFEDKMIAVFSMLFGAGIVMAAGRTVRPAWVHYRRMAGLLVIGLVHAFGLWYGDILNTYAACGMVLYPLRRARAGVLIGLGVVVFTGAAWARVGPAMAGSLWPETKQESVEGAAASAGAPGASGVAAESRGDRVWREALEGEKAAYLGSWWDLFVWRAKLNEIWHWQGGYAFSFWRCGGFVLIGMGLMKLGVFGAGTRGSLYWGLVLGGYGLGAVLYAPAVWPGLARVLGRPIEMGAGARQVVGLAAWTMKYVAAAPIALGHVGVVMLAWRAEGVRAAMKPLAAVGRVALTNYIMQTVIAVIVFDGWAMGRWGTWRMSEIAAFVVAVWAAQIVISVAWMRNFRFGPLEWVWRSATYGEVQPMKRATL